MHILLTNDDGVYAPGLLILKQALAPLAKLTIVAPERNYSAAGHRKTLHKPLRLEAVKLQDGTPAWMCSGAPSDCVALALLGFVSEKIDLVVSGINPYPNLGQDVTYSGTVMAALEAVIAHVPGIAVSGGIAAIEGKTPADILPAIRVAADVVRAVQTHGLPSGVALNVNVPEGPLRGYRVTRQGHSIYRDELVTRTDPWGRPYYWIGGQFPQGIEADGTDFGALAEGYVSITPLHLDLTAYAALAELEQWEWMNQLPKP